MDVENTMTKSNLKKGSIAAQIQIGLNLKKKKYLESDIEVNPEISEK